MGLDKSVGRAFRNGLALKRARYRPNTDELTINIAETRRSHKSVIEQRLTPTNMRATNGCTYALNRKFERQHAKGADKAAPLNSTGC